MVILYVCKVHVHVCADNWICEHTHTHTHTHTCIHSGFFNGATFFNSVGEIKPSQGDIATGAMFLIVGFLWILGLPLAILLLVMVRLKVVVGIYHATNTTITLYMHVHPLIHLL